MSVYEPLVTSASFAHEPLPALRYMRYFSIEAFVFHLSATPSALLSAELRVTGELKVCFQPSALYALAKLESLLRPLRVKVYSFPSLSLSHTSESDAVTPTDFQLPSSTNTRYFATFLHFFQLISTPVAVLVMPVISGTSEYVCL